MQYSREFLLKRQLRACDERKPGRDARPCHFLLQRKPHTELDHHLAMTTLVQVLAYEDNAGVLTILAMETLTVTYKLVIVCCSCDPLVQAGQHQLFSCMSYCPLSIS